MLPCTYDEINKTNVEKVITILKDGFRVWADLRRHPEYIHRTQSKHMYRVRQLKLTCSLCHTLGCAMCPLFIPDKYCRWTYELTSRDFPHAERSWFDSGISDLRSRRYCADKIARVHLKVIFDLKQKFGVK